MLDDAYAGVPDWNLRAAAERGEALHRLCLSYLASLGGLCQAPTSIPSEYQPAYNSFVNWCSENYVVPIAIEQEGVNALNGFRGHPDALVLFGPDQILLLIDLKFTASILRINRVQVQAYCKLDLYKTAQRAILLHIHPITGEIRTYPIKHDPRDWAAFLNALSIWKWRQS